jgi:hypothetical protein
VGREGHVELSLFMTSIGSSFSQKEEENGGRAHLL